MKLSVLASGSKANASILEADGSLILIDCGLSCTQLETRMRMIGIEPQAIDAIALTHEHADHSAGLEQFGRRYGTPVYANRLTATALITKGVNVCWRIFNGEPFGIGNIGAQAFRVEHDAADPCGFVFDGVFAYATDLGTITEAMRAAVRPCTSLFIEANYDERLLARDTTRPAKVKLRTASGNGHLSNQQAARFIAQQPELRAVILGHLSASTNTPMLAMNAVLDEDDEHPSEDATLEVAFTPESERCKPPRTFPLL